MNWGFDTLGVLKVSWELETRAISELTVRIITYDPN